MRFSLFMCKSFIRRLFSWLPDALSLVPVYRLYRCSVAGVLHATDSRRWFGSADDGPTPAFSGAAGDLHRPARATMCYDAKRSRPGQGPRQRRPLQSNVGRRDLEHTGKASLKHSSYDVQKTYEKYIRNIILFWYEEHRKNRL